MTCLLWLDFFLSWVNTSGCIPMCARWVAKLACGPSVKPPEMDASSSGLGREGGKPAGDAMHPAPNCQPAGQCLAAPPSHSPILFSRGLLPEEGREGWLPPPPPPPLLERRKLTTSLPPPLPDASAKQARSKGSWEQNMPRFLPTEVVLKKPFCDCDNRAYYVPTLLKLQRVAESGPCFQLQVSFR